MRHKGYNNIGQRMESRRRVSRFVDAQLQQSAAAPSAHAQTIKKTLYLEVVIALQLKSRCRRPLAVTAVTWYGEQIVPKRSIARAKLLKQMLKINRYCWTEFVILNLCRWTFNCTWKVTKCTNRKWLDLIVTTSIEKTKKQKFSSYDD